MRDLFSLNKSENMPRWPATRAEIDLDELGVTNKKIASGEYSLLTVGYNRRLRPKGFLFRLEVSVEIGGSGIAEKTVI